MDQRHCHSGLTRGRPSGYTLLEVLMVVVLLAIAVGLVLPSLGDTRLLRLREAARLLAADIEFAQNDSIAHSDKPRTIKFDPATNRYWIAPIPPRDVAPTTAVYPPVAGEARGSAVFTTSTGNFASELNARNISTGLKNLFAAGGYTLSTDAILYVVQKDSSWLLNDWTSSYTLRVSGAQLLAVRDEPFLMTLGTGRASAASGVSIQSVSSAYTNEIRFDAYGSPGQTTDAVVTLCSGTYTITVRVAAASGEVTIQ